MQVLKIPHSYEGGYFKTFMYYANFGIFWYIWYIDGISTKNAFLAFQDSTLFMSNQILKRFVKKNIDFHQKFAKIERLQIRPLEKNY